MAKENQRENLLNLLLRKTGGWYIVIVTTLTHFIAVIGTIAADYTIRVNIEFSPERLAGLVQLALYLFLVSTLLVIGFVMLRYRKSRQRLNAWKNGTLKYRDEAGWREITSLSWEFAIFLFVRSVFIEILPVVLYVASFPDANFDQVVYAGLAVLAGVINTVTIALILIEFLLKPAREALLPNRFDEQLNGDQSLRLSQKIQITVLTIIITTLLLIAPIGYHQTQKAIETGMTTVSNDMRNQSFVVAGLIVIYGMIFTGLIGRAITQPINTVLSTFTKIDEGDLSARVKVSASDEIGQVAIYFNRLIARLESLQSNLETQIAQRTEQLRATAEVGRAASSILDPDQLVEEIVNLITERLGYYYAAIFIISPDGTWAELRSATGEAGAELKARQHRLAVGGKSMVGSAISLRQARIAHDVGLEAVRFNNPLLPDTRSEIALPLIVGNRVIGALDAQSTQPNAFDAENIETLLGMANQVAIALENARLYQDAQNALREIRENQRTQLAQVWSEAAETGEALEFSVGQENYQVESDDAILNIPLALRDQVIGEISILGDEPWTAEDRAWASAVARQTAFAIENARLLEESQQTALQERIITEITGKIWSATTIDGILQVAIKELGRTLSANEAVIKLDVEE